MYLLYNTTKYSNCLQRAIIITIIFAGMLCDRAAEPLTKYLGL